MKVVIAGASGYVGSSLASSLSSAGHDVICISRRASGSSREAVGWDRIPFALDGADAVVNLAGASIGAPFWTARRKRELRTSRIETTRALAEGIAAAEPRPAVFLTASGIDYYGDSGDQPVDEAAPAGFSFLAGLCVAWEAAAAPAPIRHVAIRTALVIGPGAPALKLMALPFRLFAGGPLGSGRQFFPWVHRDDLVAIYRRALEEASLAGALNAVAPEQLRQAEAARVFGAVLHRPSILPAPAFALRLALGEQADLLLHGQRASSSRLGGFDFAYPTLRPALENAFGRRSP